jgi:hypothetical protein
MNANPRYLEAVSFAVERHGLVAQARKGTDFPYVIHPIRVAEILSRFGYTEDVVVAGLLHDTIEDAGVTVDELRRCFGDRVAELVEAASEPDKSLDWRTRKQHTIDRVADLDTDAVALIVADKLDNVRSLQDTLRARGKRAAWKIFNADEESQHWYYRTLAQSLLDRDPDKPLVRTLDAEVHELFPDERRATRFFAGKSLGNRHDARAHLADPIKHWKPRYSAYELATAWLTGDGVPSEVHALLGPHLGDYEIVEGFFEKDTKLDDFGRASQTDLLLLLRTADRYVVVGIEGKAREGFEDTVSARTRNQRRLDGLCRHLGINPDAVGDLKYQLLHRTVATLLEADRYGVEEAIMLVHSFDAQDASFNDYLVFAERLDLDGAVVNGLTSPKKLGNVTLRLGWARRVI